MNSKVAPLKNQLFLIHLPTDKAASGDLSATASRLSEHVVALGAHDDGVGL